ncbi:hypothetical protein ACG7TL_003093 [Trametes sanguinea]
MKQPQPHHQLAVDPAALQALAYAQQLEQQQQVPIQHSRSWGGPDNGLRHAYPVQGAGMAQLHPAAASVSPMDYHTAPQTVPGGAGQQVHPQQIQLIALQRPAQAQVAQHPVVPQDVYQLVHPPVQVRTAPARDPFIYVQREVREAMEDTAVLERIQQRALFVAPPVGRLRTPQACERCRKRKTKHRANKTKKAVAEREEATRLAEEAAAMAQAVGAAGLEAMCPPARPSFSSSSGYSDASAASLPPLLATRGYSHLPMAAPSYSSSSGYSAGSSLMSALPTPVIMLDGRPLGATTMLSHIPAAPVSRSRSGSQLGRAAPPNSPAGSQAVSRSSSAMSLQQAEFMPPSLKASMSCNACVSEMAGCAACIEEKKSLRAAKQRTNNQRQRSKMTASAAPDRGTASLDHEADMKFFTALTEALSQQAIDREMSSSPDIPLASLMPHIARGSSSSSSASGAQSGAQTPMDYFSLPLPQEQSAYSPATENMMKISESMAMANLGAFDGTGGVYPSSSGFDPLAPIYDRDGEGALQFSDIFHSFDLDGLPEEAGTGPTWTHDGRPPHLHAMSSSSMPPPPPLAMPANPMSDHTLINHNHSSQQQQQQQPSSPLKEFPVFEFTKRKRWADLLITEVSDTLILVLSEACQVWYCGNAVTELLGWRDDELVDGDLIDLMNGNRPVPSSSRPPQSRTHSLTRSIRASRAADDRANFRAAFSESVRSRTEMLAYCKNEFYVASDLTSAPREVLFEIRGRPHFLPATDEFKCYFAMAQPYPSRNIAMLNTFLELKTENERLQQRVAQLRSQSLALDGPSDNFFANSDGFGAADGGAGGGGGSARSGFDMNTAGLGSEMDEDGPRKKAKRLAAEQHGPRGPKTLCNACGLRWAKKSRKPSEAEGEAGASEGHGLGGADGAQGGGSGPAMSQPEPASDTPRVEDTSPLDWKYVAEGGSTIVFSYAGPPRPQFDGTVLRLRKRPLSAHAEAQAQAEGAHRAPSQPQPQPQSSSTNKDEDPVPTPAPAADQAPPSLASPAAETDPDAAAAATAATAAAANDEEPDDPTIVFQRTVIERLLPRAHLPRLAAVHVARPWLAQLAAHAEPLRPPERRTRDAIDLARRKAVLATDLVGGDGWAVEIKPKWGFLPAPTHLAPATRALKTRTCRFCMHAHLRRLQASGGAAGEVAEGYCPLDLFSGEPGRVRRALEALWDAWVRSGGAVNSLRVFVRGSTVRPRVGKVSGLSSSSVRSVLMSWDANQAASVAPLAEQLFPPSPSPSPSPSSSASPPSDNTRPPTPPDLPALRAAFTSALLPVLLHTPVLRTLSTLQRTLDALDVEGLARLWARVRGGGDGEGGDGTPRLGAGEREPDVREWAAFVERYLARQQQQEQQEEDGVSGGASESGAEDEEEEEEEELRYALLAYLLSASFKDCSLIVRMPPPASSSPSPSPSPTRAAAAAEEATVTVIDLDVKPLARLAKWAQLDAEIVDAYRAVGEPRACVDARATGARRDGS